MKRASLVLVGVFVLLTGISLGASAAAMNNTCENSYPKPYTGGADVAKSFHLSDGSTVTITVTGAVIKQGRCDTPYREGWISPSDICDIHSAQDLNGRLSSGSSNPNGSSGFTGCSTATKSSSESQTPAKASTSASSTATANATATVNVTAAPAVKAATTTTAVTQPAATVKTLPNTGPGNILMLSGATSAIGTLGHLYYSRRRRQR